MTTKTSILQKITTIPNPGWRHRIDVGHGIITPGREDSTIDIKRLALEIDLSNNKVLDIGCSDGYFSFECEARGAKVTAIENFTSTPDNNGISGFSIASDMLDSSVQFFNMSVYDLDQLHDNYDIILFLNVLYHLRHPTLALDKIYSKLRPGGKLLMKTYFHQDIRFRSIGFDYRWKPYARFFEGNELNNDPSNWWGLNRRCIEALLRSCGFQAIEKTGKYSDRLYYCAQKPID